MRSPPSTTASHILPSARTSAMTPASRQTASQNASGSRTDQAWVFAKASAASGGGSTTPAARWRSMKTASCDGCRTATSVPSQDDIIASDPFSDRKRQHRALVAIRRHAHILHPTLFEQLRIELEAILAIRIAEG